MPHKFVSISAAILLSLQFVSVNAQDTASVYDADVHGQWRTKLFSPAKEVASLPKSVDNSVLPYFPPVIDQRGNSCAQASGIGYLYTYEVNRLLGRNASASADNRFSYQFSWNMVNGGEDEGGFVDEGLSLALRYGIMAESDYGTSSTYQFRWATGYDKYLRSMRYRSKEILTFEGSVPLMKRWLYDAGDGSAHGGLLTFSGTSTGWHIDNGYQGPSETGYHSLLTSLATSGSHAMTIAGYDDTVAYTDEAGVVHEGAFIVVNTWGTFSHDNGRFYLPYDFFLDESVPGSVLSDQVVALRVQTYRPQVVLKVKLDYSSRNDLRLGMGCSENADADRPGQFYYSYAFYHQGGDYPMQGNGESGTIELALDATEALPDTTADYPVYFLNVVRSMIGKKKGEGRLLALSVIDYRKGEPVETECAMSLPATLNDGDNIFAIRGQRYVSTTASPVTYLDGSGNVIPRNYEIADAEGNIHSVTFSNRNSDKNTITIRHEKE